LQNPEVNWAGERDYKKVEERNFTNFKWNGETVSTSLNPRSKATRKCANQFKISSRLKPRAFELDTP